MEKKQGKWRGSLPPDRGSLGTSLDERDEILLRRLLGVYDLGDALSEYDPDILRKRNLDKYDVPYTWTQNQMKPRPGILEGSQAQPEAQRFSTYVYPGAAKGDPWGSQPLSYDGGLLNDEQEMRREALLRYIGSRGSY